MKIEDRKNWLSGFRSLLFFSTCFLVVEVGWSQSVPEFTLPDSVCENTAVSFINTTQVAADDTLSFNWIIQDETIAFSNTDNPRYTWKNNGKYTVKLIIENQDGDTASTSRTIDVGSTPKVEVSWSNGCTLFPIKFTAVADRPNLTYSWDVGDTLASDSSFQYVYNTVGDRNLRLNVHSQYGCSLTVDSTVFVDELVIADFDADITCFGDTTFFVNKNIDSEANYTWQFGDINSDSGIHVKHLYSEPKVYNVTLSARKGFCTDAVTKQVVVQELPDASFSISTEGRQVTCDGPNGNDAYRWSFGDGGKSEDQNPVYLYSFAQGVYEICLATRKGNCWSQNCEQVSFPISVGDIFGHGIQVYPNPSRGLITIQTHEGLVIKSIELLTVQGISVDGKLKQSAESLNISERPAGTYILQIETDKGILYHKLQLVK